MFLKLSLSPIFMLQFDLGMIRKDTIQNFGVMTLTMYYKYYFVFEYFGEINSKKLNINRYNYSLKIISFVIKAFVQHTIKRVNKSRKMNLGLATVVLPGPFTFLLNCFTVSISLLRKIIHTIGLLY